MQLRVECLTKNYGGIRALDGVTLEIQPGTIVAVLGANGAGKTTLLQALSGVVFADSGNVYFDNERYTPGREDLRLRFAALPDIPSIPPLWTPLRFICTLALMYGTSPVNLEERIVKVLEELDILSVARWRISSLSRGQIYKTMLAGFVIADPEVWFVDEPFSSGMDPRGLNFFKNHARTAVQKGHSIVYSTQIIEVAEQFSNQVILLTKGRIAGNAPLEVLRTDGNLSEFVGRLQEAP